VEDLAYLVGPTSNQGLFLTDETSDLRNLWECSPDYVYAIKVREMGSNADKNIIGKLNDIMIEEYIFGC
jgi:hypothetical protein